MKLTIKLHTIVLLIVFSNIASYSQVYDWRGPNRTGIYEEENLLKEWSVSGPELLWEKNEIGFGYSSAVVTKESVYVTGRKGDNDILTALSLNGIEKWSIVYGNAWTKNFDGTRCTPTVVGDHIFVVTGGGDIVCVDTEGKIIWSKNHYKLYNAKPAMFGVSESPLYVDGKIIVSPGGNKASLVAFSTKNGEVIWEAEPLNEEPLYVNPLLVNHNNKKIIVTNTNRFIIGVDATSGELLWKVNYDKESDIGGGRVFKNHAITPIYHDGKILIANGQKFIGLQLGLSDNGTSVETLWKNKELNPHLGGMVLVNGYIYCSNFLRNSMGNWVCVDWETGETQWSTPWHNKGSIISDGEMLYMYEEKYGNVGIAKANPEKLEVISEFKIEKGKSQHWAHPVIQNGSLYIRHEEALMVYDIREK